MSDVKKPSVTENYKEHIQAIIFQELGVKVSKDKAWKLFKAVIKGTVQFVENVDGNRLSLAGVGKFEIRKSPARGKKAEQGYPFIPRFRFRPSTVIADEVEKAMGVGSHDDIEVVNYGVFKEDAPVVAEEAPIMNAPVEEPQAAPVDDFFNL